MILWGWKHLLDEAALEADPITELLRVYREVNARTKAEEALLEECKHELVNCRAATRRTWRSGNAAWPSRSKGCRRSTTSST